MRWIFFAFLFVVMIAGCKPQSSSKKQVDNNLLTRTEITHYNNVLGKMEIGK